MTNEPFYETRTISDIRDLLRQSCELFPQRSVFKYHTEEGNIREIKYAHLYKRVNEIGTALCAMGIKDKKIAVMGSNSYKWCYAYFAVTCGTGVVVPIDKELMAEDVKRILLTADCSAIFCDEKSFEIIFEIRDSLPENLIIISLNDSSENGVIPLHDLVKTGKKLLADGNSDFTDAVIDAEKLGILIFTSGTTGNAKGVMLSHRNICSDITAVASVVKITEEDVILSVLPLHHTYECTLSFLMLLYSGGCLCFCRGLRYIQKDLLLFEPTLFVTVPLMLEKFHSRIIKKVTDKKMGKLALSLGKLAAGSEGFMANMTEKAFAEVKKQFGGKLRLVIAGAAALNPDVAADFNMFGIPVYIGYGLTECSPLVIGNNDRLRMTDGVGVPLPGVEVKINNPDDNDVGEIYVKGPMVMIGYYKNEEATSEVFEDGWFRTGDMGTIDKDGHVRVVGRFKNVIVTKNGKNIYPEEVEYYLNSNPYISESLVFGSDVDENAEGTRVEAKIFPDVAQIMTKLKEKTQPTTEQISKIISDVVMEVNKKLPNYKHIKKYDIREDEFIKTTTNKIKRQNNMDDDTNKKE